MVEVVEQQQTKKDVAEKRDSAAKLHEDAFRAFVELRNEFTQKPGYVREKQPDELAYLAAKDVFGEFSPHNIEAMKKNSNDGKGVDVTLPDGNVVHLENQAELYEKTVAFNEERGGFYDEKHISKTSPEDYQRLQDVNALLEKSQQEVINSFEKQAYAYKRMASIEEGVLSEQNAAPKIKDTPAPKDKPEDKPEPAEPKVKVDEAPADDKQNATESAAAKPEEPTIDVPDGTRVAVSDFVYQDAVPIDWASRQNETALSHMRHTMALSFLQEDRFSVERDHFYNEIHKRSGKQIETTEEAAEYLSKILDSKESDSILRDAAPGAVAATNEYINNIDIDRSFQDAGYPPERITPEFRENMQITQAFANRIGGEEGQRSFMDTLKEQKDNYLRGLGDPKVGLAITGTMLGIGIVAGSGPAAIAIGGAKLALQFTNHLLETEKGKAFQQAVYGTATNFLEKVGVKPEVIQGVTDSVKDLWEKTTGNRWAKLAMMGAAAFAFVTFGPTASELGAAHATNIPAVPDIDPSLSDTAPSTEAPKVENGLSQKEGAALSESSDSKPGDSSQPNAAERVDGPAPVFDLYQIQSGDTLWDIAKQSLEAQNPGQAPNDVQLINMVNEIAAHNGIDNPNLIHSGDSIEIPYGTNPSMEVVSGPTDWLKAGADSSAVSNRLDGMSDRMKDWKPETPDDGPAPMPRGTMRV